MIDRLKIVVKEKAKAIYNIFICVIFIKIGVYLITLKSHLKIMDLPLYPTIGVMVVVVNLILLLKWIVRFYKTTIH